MLYADTSVLARAFLGDEPDSSDLELLLFESDAVVVTSELSRVELARVVTAAERARRIESADDLLAVIDTDLTTAIGLLPLRPATVLPEARRIVLDHRVRTLDAIHLAVALELRDGEEDEVTFVTRDADQAAAAKALGFSLA
ncbi:MAG: type II toxin-antitoxin system VapC family toxin [Actinobacteria bacterium]|nr:type II toxin-antitoxin system VapC family toxin [Actinomycetota bacterium]